MSGDKGQQVAPERNVGLHVKGPHAACLACGSGRQHARRELRGLCYNAARAQLLHLQARVLVAGIHLHVTAAVSDSNIMSNNQSTTSCPAAQGWSDVCHRRVAGTQHNTSKVRLKNSVSCQHCWYLQTPTGCLPSECPGAAERQEDTDSHHAKITYW